jgi:endonuclease/exonuclease/phosphatase family metal-dependent hydrolase
MLSSILSYNTHGLPWSRDESKHITAWIKRLKPPILCLQEVFTERARNYYKKQLELYGYTIVIPNDIHVSILNSGLVTGFLTVHYDYISSCFCPFLDFHNVEISANKGFHTLRLRCKSTHRPINIVNTHTQSDTEISWWFGPKVTMNVRKKQFAQIVHFFENTTTPTLVAGDLNCEYSPHPYLRFLQVSGSLIRKNTFYSTGEDLDHIGWLPLQWMMPSCSFCNIDALGPQLRKCVIFQAPWSDHAPIFATIYIPNRKIAP